MSRLQLLVSEPCRSCKVHNSSCKDPVREHKTGPATYQSSVEVQPLFQMLYLINNFAACVRTCLTLHHSNSTWGAAQSA